MKKLLFTSFFLLSICRCANAQITDAYIGVQAGVAFPVGVFAADDPLQRSSGFAKPGLSLNLLNLGVTINNGIGIHASVFNSVNNLDVVNIDEWRQRGVLVGPSYSIGLTNDIHFDIKPAIGLSILTIPDFGRGKQRGVSLAYGLGTQFRFDVVSIISFSVSADYMSTESNFNAYNYIQQANTIVLGAGISFILK